MLAKGEIGLIIPGHMYVHPFGRGNERQIGIHSEDMIPGLRRLTDAVHEEGGKIVFQLSHAGLQTTKKIIGRRPQAPSGKIRNPLTLRKPAGMSDEEIQGTIEAFKRSAERAVAAGADGIQLHGAHGFLINEFLSPFFNKRDDEWGGTDEKRFRLMREIIRGVRKAMPSDMQVLVKLNANDFTPATGITPELARKYAEWLVDEGIDGLEVSCGTFFTLHTIRGVMPSREMAKAFPVWMRPLAKLSFKRLAPQCGFEEAYNLGAAEVIKPALGNIPLILVGGLRRRSHMESLIEGGHADFISMSRSFIREPLLVKRFREGKQDSASCASCNRCFAAVSNHFPLRCYREEMRAQDVQGARDVPYDGRPL
jgi:2,4-dienoyl-CoA reductase-like NADH-dependent reductase (Old Yellow Enzyme family)